MPARPTHALAERHEALVLHLSALQKSVTAIAAKRPEAAVPAATRVLAEALLFDCAPFLPRPSSARFPVAAPQHGALLVQLGQALAGLDAYEARHAVWDEARNGFVWRLANNQTLPIARLRQAIAAPADPDIADTMGVIKRGLRALAQRHEQQMAKLPPP